MGDWQTATYRRPRPPPPSTSKLAQNTVPGLRPSTQGANPEGRPLTQSNIPAGRPPTRVANPDGWSRPQTHITNPGGLRTPAQSTNPGGPPTQRAKAGGLRTPAQSTIPGGPPTQRANVGGRLPPPFQSANPSGRPSGLPAPSVSLTQTTINDIAPKKKKNKKTGTKEERMRKREEKKFNEMYEPRDTKVTVISAALMDKFRGLSTRQLPRTPTLINSSSTESQNLTASAPSLENDFPSLGASLPMTPILARTSVSKKPVSEVQPESPLPGQHAISSFELDSPATISTICDSTVTDTPVATSVKRRANKPLVIDITEFLKPKKEMTEDATPEGKSQKSMKAARLLNNDRNIKKPGNILDSSGPIVINRGKIRKPKVKKPSPLKRAILTSRSLRKVTFGARFGCGQSLIPVTPIKEELSTDTSGSTNPTPEGNAVPLIVDDKQEVKSEIENNTSESDINHGDFFRALIEDTAREAQRKLVPVSADVVTQVKIQMHRRKFRTYCDMYVTKELHGHVIALLKFLHRLQDKLYHTDPIKYSAKRRYVVGLKNATSYLSLNKVRLIIIAPDLEQSSVEGGLDEKVEDLIQYARERKVPYIFSGHRFILGYPVFVKSAVSAIAILDYQGAEDLVKVVVSESKLLRDKYQEDFDQKVQELTTQMEGAKV